MLVLTQAIAGQTLYTVYKRDGAGLVHEVWLLNAEEYAKVGGINLGDPTGTVAGLSCKVYRLKLDLDNNPEADNVVFIRAEFQQVRIPTPDLGVIAPNLTPINGIDVYVYNFNDHYLGQGHGGSLLFPGDEGDPYDLPTGASSFNEPEIGSFKATQPEYDIVVGADPGINTGFTLKLTYSNELFDAPFEALDPTDTLEPLDKSDTTTDFENGITTPPVEEGLAELPVSTDQDIAGVGLGVSEQFDPAALENLDRATRNISATQKPPSGLALVLGLVVFPTFIIIIVGLTLRRRRHALI